VCGIGGAVNADPARPANPTVLTAMGEAMAHRGPHDAGLWWEGPTGLVHRRLSVLDPTPAGHQPMHSPDGRYVIVYNGEVYNYLELRAELTGKGITFRTRCDTEVLLAAYAAWGEDMLDRLNGMFAFAIFDREAQRLFAARDRLGIKPLFYTQRNGCLAFASELDALRAGRFTDGALDANALDAYLTYLYVPAPHTIYRDVHKLEPGEKLRYHHGRLEVSSYWRPRYEANDEWTVDTAAEAYRELLWDAVRLRLRSDVPLGAFLSGGLDSSSVVAAMSDQMDRPVKTFSIGFEDAEADELTYARLAARHLGTEHTESVLTPDMAELLPGLVRHFGEPFADSSALPMWLVSKLAREQVTVALSGDGGDELFAGYTWLHMNRRVAALRRVPALLRRPLHAALHLLPSTPRTGKLRRFSGDAFLTPDESFRRRLSCFGAEERERMYVAAFADEVRRNRRDRFGEHCATAKTLSDDDRMLHLDTVMYLPNDILTKVDRMSMAHGLEVRVPLLDHRLVDFAGTVPFDLKYGGGISKIIAKRAMDGILPPPLLRQRKRGFAIPIDRWFRESLVGLYEETVLAPDARCAAFVRREALHHCLERHRSRKEQLGHRLWALLVLEHWLRG